MNFCLKTTFQVGVYISFLHTQNVPEPWSSEAGLTSRAYSWMGKEITVWPILSGASLLASLHLQCFLFCSEDKHGALVWGRLCADVFHTEGGLPNAGPRGEYWITRVLCKVPLWIACVWFSSPTGITLSKGKSSRTLESENDPTVCVSRVPSPGTRARVLSLMWVRDKSADSLVFTVGVVSVVSFSLSLRCFASQM